MSRPRLDLLLEIFFLPPDLAARVAGREFLGLEDLADLDLGPAVERGALEPLDGFVERLHLPGPKASHQLLGLGERPVRHGALLPVELDALAVLAGLEALAGEHHARLHQLLVEVPHLLEDFLVRKLARLRILVRLDDHHDAHCRLLFGLSCLYSGDERAPTKSTRRCKIVSSGPVIQFYGAITRVDRRFPLAAREGAARRSRIRRSPGVYRGARRSRRDAGRGPAAHAQSGPDRARGAAGGAHSAPRAAALARSGARRDARHLDRRILVGLEPRAAAGRNRRVLAAGRQRPYTGPGESGEHPATGRGDPRFVQDGGRFHGGRGTDELGSDGRGAGAAGESGRDILMTPTDWTSLAEWVTAFRALHEEARKGKLTARDLARYYQDREVLAKALLIAQRLSIKPGVTPRQTLRVGLSLSVELVSGNRSERATTLDLGVGGFAALFPKPMKVMEQFGFVLTLKGAGGAVSGRARVVNLQRKGKPFRVAFAFEDLPQADSERISLEVFDAALATIPPK